MSENTVSQKRMRMKKKLSKNGMFYGDSIVFIIIHNIFSVIIFFGLTVGIGLFSGTLTSNGPIEAIKFFLDVCFISFVAGVIGRSLAIIFLKFIIERTMNVSLRGGKERSMTQAVSFLLIGIIGLVSIVSGLDMSYYIFGLLVLLYLAINKFNNKSLVFIIASLISSGLWVVGMLAIVQSFLFVEETFWTAVLTYFGVKVVIYILAKIIVDSRL